MPPIGLLAFRSFPLPRPIKISPLPPDPPDHIVGISAVFPFQTDQIQAKRRTFHLLSAPLGSLLFIFHFYSSPHSWWDRSPKVGRARAL